MAEAGELSEARSEAASSGDAEAGRELGHEQQMLGVLERAVRLRVRARGLVVEAVEGVEAAAHQLPRGGPGGGGGHQTLAEDGGRLMNAGLAPGNGSIMKFKSPILRCLESFQRYTYTRMTMPASSLSQMMWAETREEISSLRAESAS